MRKIIGLLILGYTHVLLASDAGHGAINWWHIGPKYKDSPALGWLTITFIIFAYLVLRAVKKPLALYLETRSKDIRQQIDEARLQQIESEKKLRFYDEKLRSLDEEINKMKNAFLAQAEAEKNDREQKAKDLEARILRDAEDTIRANTERAKNRLAEETIAHALTRAERTIAEQKQNQVEEVLNDSFLSDLRESAAEVKRGYVVSEVTKSQIKHEMRARAAEEVQ